MLTPRRLLTIVGLVFVPALGLIEPAKGFQTAGFQETLVASGLTSPTAMELAPDGRRLFVAEQSGRLRVIRDGTLLPTDFVTLSVTSNSERGLLGVAFDPDFATNRFVYVYYTRATLPIKNRVSRFTASASNPDVAAPGEVVILDDIASDAGNHNGGAIHFGLDGMLYVAIGDGGSTPSNSQSLSTLSGKLLRINPDGSVPPDNPFVGTAGARGEIWALGLRNPYTFAVDPVTGAIHINDVGAGSWEEINLGAPGANYGWPVCEGVCADPDFTNPIHTYTHAVGQAITGGTFYRGTTFPSQYAGSYFFADYLGGWIKRLDQNNQVSDFWNPQNGPVDLKVGPGGALLYLSIFDGAVYRIQYQAASNQPPTATFTAIPLQGPAPLSVTFNASGSADPNGDALSYSWNFGDGSPAGAGVTVSHTYQKKGPYTAVLTVSDGRGGVATASRRIQVKNR
jgi:glucose/arabinose dehydrogenase